MEAPEWSSLEELWNVTNGGSCEISRSSIYPSPAARWLPPEESVSLSVCLPESPPLPSGQQVLVKRRPAKRRDRGFPSHNSKSLATRNDGARASGLVHSVVCAVARSSKASTTCEPCAL